MSYLFIEFTIKYIQLFNKFSWLIGMVKNIIIGSNSGYSYKKDPLEFIQILNKILIYDLI